MLKYIRKPTIGDFSNFRLKAFRKSGFEDNIETEYEHKFASLGLPIYRLEAYLEDKGTLI